jgi:hypothetical protein
MAELHAHCSITTGNTYKQAKCPYMDEWRNKILFNVQYSRCGGTHQIPALGRLGQENFKLKVSLRYIGRFCLKALEEEEGGEEEEKEEEKEGWKGEEEEEKGRKRKRRRGRVEVEEE